ncbi:MAG: DUF349 domain-containing protein [Streptosporangiales bacterium]
MTSDPWGRVDDDGTVYVRTAAGERVVGSWQAGSPEEALTFFHRRYAELATEVDLLEQRVGRGAVPPDQANVKAEALRGSVRDAAAVGDLDSLLARLDALQPAIEERRTRQREERARQREEAREHKERLVAEAEEIGTNGTRWKAGGDRLRELIDQWKTLERLDRATDQALWKRLAGARNAFAKRRRRYFSELSTQQEETRAVKEDLVTQAEALGDSTDWGATAGRFRDLMTQWRAAGRAERKVDDRLWARFKSAQDAFFAARSEAFAERDAGQRANLERKEELAQQAERLLPVTNVRGARAELRRVRDEWHEAGPVPRADRPRVEARLRKVEDAVHDAERAQWQRTNPEARARAEATVTQLRESIAKLDEEAGKADAAGQEHKAREARESASARREWLTEAERALTDFS